VRTEQPHPDDVTRLQNEVITAAFNFSREGGGLFRHLEMVVEVRMFFHYSSHVVYTYYTIGVTDDEQFSRFILVHAFDWDVFVFFVKRLGVHEFDQGFQALLQCGGSHCLNTHSATLVRNCHERV